MEFLLAVFCVAFTTIGQLFFKIGANREKLYKNVYTYGAYSSFVLVMVIAYQLLKSLNLKYFVVIMSSNYISVAIASVFFLKEKCSIEKVIGTLFVAIGVIIFML